mmetsp:Transcript_9921/g.33656  ORF Transcript_9921/g.33656 Transcript_9921/m.33656 type:complete len:466 (-) Transcript_9921:1400-2797(-)
MRARCCRGSGCCARGHAPADASRAPAGRHVPEPGERRKAGSWSARLSTPAGGQREWCTLRPWTDPIAPVGLARSGSGVGHEAVPGARGRAAAVAQVVPAVLLEGVEVHVLDEVERRAHQVHDLRARLSRAHALGDGRGGAARGGLVCARVAQHLGEVLGARRGLVDLQFHGRGRADHARVVRLAARHVGVDGRHELLLGHLEGVGLAVEERHAADLGAEAHGGHLDRVLVEAHLADDRLGRHGRRHVAREARGLDDVVVLVHHLVRADALELGHLGRHAHADSDRLAVEEGRVGLARPRGVLDGVAHSVAVLRAELVVVARVVVVEGGGLDLERRAAHVLEVGAVVEHLRGVAIAQGLDDGVGKLARLREAVLERLGHAVEHVALGEGGEGVGVDGDHRGRVVAPEEVLAQRVVDGLRSRGPRQRWTWWSSGGARGRYRGRACRRGRPRGCSPRRRRGRRWRSSC